MGYGNNPYVAKFACEFIGTMMLVCVVQLASSQQRDLAPIAIGLVLMNMIYCLGHISGAHFNPAVTIAILVRNIPQFPRHDTFNVFGYFISQYLGGICGGLLSWSIGGHDTAYHWPHVQDSPTAPVKGVEIWYVFQGEFVFTFLLAFVVLNVATDQRISNNQFYGVAIGTTLMLAAFAIGPISGCIINPAVWVGTVSIASAAAKGHEPIYVYHFYAFWLAHLAGGTLAGVVYNTFIKNSLSDGKALEPETFEVAPDENVETVSDNATTDVEMR